MNIKPKQAHKHCTVQNRNTAARGSGEKPSYSEGAATQSVLGRWLPKDRIAGLDSIKDY